MLLRAAVGAIAGAVVGAGFQVNLSMFVRYCNGGPSRTGCGEAFPQLVPVIFAFWIFVAGVLVALGFRAAREARGWWAIGIGSGLWVVSIVSVAFSGLLGKHSDIPITMDAAMVLVPCLAYGLAALATSRRAVAKPC